MTTMMIGGDFTATFTAAQIQRGEAGGPVGMKAMDKAGDIYKLLEYKAGSGTVAAVAKTVAYYYTLDGYKLNQMTSDLSDTIEIGAGVLQSAPADGEFAWVKIRGPETLSVALSAGSDGDPLTPTGATDGTLDLATAITDHICAYAGDISDKEIICMFPF